MSEVRQQRIVRLVRHLATFDGITQSRLAGVRFIRADASIDRIPVLYEPSIVIVCQGYKRRFPGDAVACHAPHHYLGLAVYLPFELDFLSSVTAPMLAVSVAIDLQVAATLVLELNLQRENDTTNAPEVSSISLDGRMSDTLLRLLEALQSEIDARILGPAIVHELLYRVLTGPQGNAIHAALSQQCCFGKIGKALRRIHAHYNAPLDVTTLAKVAGMSVAAFHAHFKAATRTTPIQYLKAIRLHKARRFMLRDGVTAAAASHLVGYESPSQFSREFKKFFGRPPALEAAVVKNALIQRPSRQGAAYLAQT